MRSQYGLAILRKCKRSSTPSRALRPGHRSIALVSDERRWHYEIEWSPMPDASLPAREALIVLTVGMMSR